MFYGRRLAFLLSFFLCVGASAGAVVDFCAYQLRKGTPDLRCFAAKSRFAQMVVIVNRDDGSGENLKAQAYFKGRQANNLELLGILQTEPESETVRTVTFRGFNPRFIFELTMKFDAHSVVEASWRALNAQTGALIDQTKELNCFGFVDTGRAE